MRIVSDRRTWRIERRIHKLGLGDGDGVPLTKLGLRNGVRMRGLGYWGAAFAVLFVWSRLPVLGAPVGLIPWQGRWLFLPGLLAYVAMTQRLDGLSPHAWAWAAVRHAVDVVRDRLDRRPVRLLGNLGVTWTPDD